MNTQIIKDELDAAAELLRRGELVAVPTETVYGLAGNGLDEQAVHDIYEVKGRPERKPLSLMVPDAGAMARYCEEIPEQAYALAERFWPGPLTIVLKAKDSVPEIVRAGGETVGLRCPDHPLTLALLKKAQIPFAAPSANPSGAPSPKTAEEVKGYFDGKIAAIVDGGPCGLGKESTLLLMTTKPYRVLRQGALPAEAIADALVEHMTILGITGGSGGGKTTALREIQRQGGLVLDCDAVYHELLAQDRELLEELDARFPGCVTDGMLDRRALGRVVFSDAEALKDLDVLLLPVGGFYTIGPEEAWKIVEELKPRCAVPMHYRGRGFGYDVIAPLEDFLKLAGDYTRLQTNSLTVGEHSGVVVLTANTHE